ncbi:aminotransferase class V-fold PLP-dependent enzyme [Inmirania thermothiophila]|uniref:Selenocysteine lyase/cysteine desulfurase n=1 Tax=Inmirania thermothiophila TaxID=1750597 RepID=A0A3N1Y0H5_9GAMM|nr:aminotransferase class V-fold PLP-dependent enzyme [Inmirania thermothiophila]ROR32339.1 selenocysteine lyase/cysteine desulfurase [Inmirania thermothiophila]
MSWWAEEFADLEVVHLNHAAVAPWPRRTAQAVARFAAENARRGSLAYREWLAVEARLRARLARLVGAPDPADIALVKNTSEALSFVAWGLDWRPGDRVVTAREEFPSNRVVWQSLARLGVETVLVPLAEAVDPEAALLAAAAHPRVRLLAVSAVQYADGLRLDLGRLGAWCRAHGRLFCVDAIQAVGAVAVDVVRDDIDFLAADGHKWMLGPEGIGVFYCRAALREALALHEYGWHMLARRDDFEALAWEVAADATRFECGSPNMVGIHGLEASLSLLEAVGMAEVERRIQEAVAVLCEGARQAGWRPVRVPRPDLPSGILALRHPRGDEAARLQALRARGVFAAHRAGALRLSPHFHLDEARLGRAVAALEATARP